MNPAESYILKHPEPYKSIMTYVRFLILTNLDHIEEKFNYGVPFYHYKKWPLVYLNVPKGRSFVDVAFVKGIELEERFPQLKDFNDRKYVRSFQVQNLEDMDEGVLISVLKAAAEIIDKSE